MSFSLPDLPANLSAPVIAKNITENNYMAAKKIYDACIEAIRKQTFPCRVNINNQENGSISHVVEKLIQAGYTANVEMKTETESDYQGEYKVTNKYLVIDNPYVVPPRM